MKNIKIYSAILSAIVLLSCNKFLDREPISQQGATTVFSTVADTRRAIAGVYSRLTGDQGYGIRLSLYYTVDNDETMGPAYSSGQLNDNDRRDIAHYKAAAENLQISNPFNQLFKGIEFANDCIEGIPQSAVYTSGSEKEKKQMQRMLGEALALRAQFYFEAIRNWGDLPEHFSTAAAQASINPFPKRVDRDIIYDRILEDLKTAATLVPWRNEITAIGDDVDERLTKGAVKALRARIALFRGGYSLRNDTKIMERKSDFTKYYQIARDECKEIIESGQHSLNPSYRDLWKNQVCGHAVADPNGELMFQVSGILLGGTSDTKLGYYNGPTINALGNKSINIMPTYLYLFDSTDERRDVTCTPYSVVYDAQGNPIKTGTTMSGIVDGKYRRDWSSNPVIAPSSAQQYMSYKWQILRYSDVLLMFAEAENEINGATADRDLYFNMVNRRGHGKPVTAADASIDLPSGLNKVDFQKHLIKQRSLEFGGEGIRKYDLIRWNLLTQALNETKANLTQLVGGSSINNVTYMAGYPSYVLANEFPKNMFYKSQIWSDDNTIATGIWANSLYSYAPFANPNISYSSIQSNYTMNDNDYEVAYIKGQTLIATLPSAANNIGKTYWVKLSPYNATATTTSSWSYNLKVNTINGEKIDGASTSTSYSGNVAATNPATTSSSSKTIAFIATANGWKTTVSISWAGSATALTNLLGSVNERYAAGFTPNKSELLPIPRAAINANSNLSQNPYY